jgi:hypothetical protein
LTARHNRASGKTLLFFYLRPHAVLKRLQRAADYDFVTGGNAVVYLNIILK